MKQPWSLVLCNAFLLNWPAFLVVQCTGVHIVQCTGVCVHCTMLYFYGIFKPSESWACMYTECTEFKTKFLRSLMYCYSPNQTNRAISRGFCSLFRIRAHERHESLVLIQCIHMYMSRISLAAYYRLYAVSVQYGNTSLIRPPYFPPKIWPH